jgi:crotonobetainyl-CoA:carnitine CoA-transferase CaiB-like acyl-CoA transferase
VQQRGALDGIRVLDFGRYVAGPFCATLLADFGADVIRIERPGGGEDRSIAPLTDEGDGALFLQINRNKRSVTFDPRSDIGREVQRRLILTADVVVVNVPESGLQAMGLDYETLCSIRSDIVLANLSSFGPRGPWAERPGFDSVGQAMCGSAYLSGPGNIPYRTPIAWVDHAAALYAAFGVMVALFERARTGRGQQISGSLLGSAVGFAASYLIEQAVRGLDRVAIGNRSSLNGPTDTFQTRDGWIATQVVGSAIFRRWAALMDEPGWTEDPRFATDALRGDNGALLSQRMQAWCAERCTAEALEALAQAHIPAGPVLSLGQVLEHPQVRAMGLFAPMRVPGLEQAVPLVAPPIELSATPAVIRRPPPRAGEHNAEILQPLGFTEAQIVALRESAARAAKAE